MKYIVIFKQIFTYLSSLERTNYYYMVKITPTHFKIDS